MVQWWEHSPPTDVARDLFSDSTQCVDWVCCWFSSLIREVFLRVLRFSPLLKKHFQILIQSSYQWTNSHSVEVPLQIILFYSILEVTTANCCHRFWYTWACVEFHALWAIEVTCQCGGKKEHHVLSVEQFFCSLPSPPSAFHCVSVWWNSTRYCSVNTARPQFEILP